MLIAVGEGRENRGLWWLGKGVFGGHPENTSGELERTQEVFGRQEEKTVTALKAREESFIEEGKANNGREDCAGRGCNGGNRVVASKDGRGRNGKKNNSQRRDRPKQQKLNNIKESIAKAEKKHKGEGVTQDRDHLRTNKEKQNTGAEKSKPRPSTVGRPLPITLGLKPMEAEGSNEDRLISADLIPHLATDLAPPPIEEASPNWPILERKHQTNVEGSTRPSVTSTYERQPGPQQTRITTTTIRPNQPSQHSNKESNSSGLQIPKQLHSSQQQSRNMGEAKNAQSPQPTTNNFRPSPATQRPYVRCPSAMLCIPKVSFYPQSSTILSNLVCIPKVHFYPHSLLQSNLACRKTVTLPVSSLRTPLPTHHS